MFMPVVLLNGFVGRLDAMGDAETRTIVGDDPQKIQRRAELLKSELEGSIHHYRRLAKNTYRMNVGIMVLAVGCSLVGGIGGLSEQIGTKVVGLFALLPGLLAVFSTTMKFQAKANQYYRRKDALKALRHRLIFELPVSPTEADIASISQQWGELNNRMNDEWERSLQFDWSHFTVDKAPRTEVGAPPIKPANSL